MTWLSLVTSQWQSSYHVEFALTQHKNVLNGGVDIRIQAERLGSGERGELTW